MGTKVPPNGGWGWAIVVAYALNSVAMIPILQGFGLVFKDKFNDLGLSATDVSVIINVNTAFGMMLGMMNGPLLKTYGYRKVAIIGSIIFSTGILLTTFANNFISLIISYGILTSLGLGVTMSAFSLAVNTYFTTKRGRAMGLAMTITGLGPIVMPQLASIMLSHYGVEGTILLFAGYSLHSIIGACLLQPIKWHMRELPESSQEDQKIQPEISEKEAAINLEKKKNDVIDVKAEMNKCERKRKLTITSINHDVEIGSIYGVETPLMRQFSEIVQGSSREEIINKFSSTMNIPNEMYSPPYCWWSVGKSLDTIHLGSCMKIFDEDSLYSPLHRTFTNGQTKSESLPDSIEINPVLQKTTENINRSSEKIDEKKSKNRSMILQALRRVVIFYDLNLLRDPIYVNLMLGMSIAIFAELNFSLLTPFILADMGLSTSEIATVMSIVASADLVFRGISPFVNEWLRQAPRTLYMFSLILLVCSRTSLIFVTNFASMVTVALGLGASKGIRSVYMTLVIPSYVPIERLPYASGIQMVVNGFIIMTAGPLIGAIRDLTGSYKYCIIFINSVTGLTITMWTIEMILVRSINLRKEKQETNGQPLNKQPKK